jgi:hypothetical protein
LNRPKLTENLLTFAEFCNEATVVGEQESLVM